jgi:hypothetical protein
VWLPSNPKGFARWFEGRSVVRVKSGVFNESKEIEPLNGPAPAYNKRPLKIAVQLLKRWRDVAFKGRMALAPSSIVLTTLAGLLYRGESHPTDALVTILDGIHRWSQREAIRLQNPTNDKEWITDRWNDKPEMYEAFIEAVYGLRVCWHKLVSDGRFPDLIDDLKDLFLDAPVSQAVKKFAESRAAARRGGALYVEKGSGALTTAAAAAVKMKDHTFYGEE